jgi:hypothetical protein
VAVCRLWLRTAYRLTCSHCDRYQYRLCPAGEGITEQCMQQTPLRFVGQSSLRWFLPPAAPHKGCGLPDCDVRACCCALSTKPVSVAPPPPLLFLYNIYREFGDVHRQGWAGRSADVVQRHGARRQPGDPGQLHVAEEPHPKKRSLGHRRSHNSGTGQDQAEPYPCQGGPETGLGNLEILDRVEIPAHLPAGRYVIGWRWDCEESNQVRWQRHICCCVSPMLID